MSQQIHAPQLEKKVLFILNVNSDIGFGHLSRCSVIASSLKSKNWDSALLTHSMSSKNHKELSVFGSVHSYEESNFNDLISFLVDKYRFSAMIIDDYKINYKKIIKNLDNDINIYRFSLQPKIDEKKYTIINSNPIYNNYNQTRHLLGTDYALISNKFKNLSKKIENQVFVFFGGGGDSGAINKYHSYFDFLVNKGLKVYLAITSAYKNYEEITKRYKGSKKITVLIDSLNFPEILNNSRFALISGGTISCESAYLSVPMQIVSIAENQLRLSSAWGSSMNAIYLGDISEVSTDCLKSTYNKYFNDNLTIEDWYSRRTSMIDGHGAERISNIILKDYNESKKI